MQQLFEKISFFFANDMADFDGYHPRRTLIFS